MDSAFGIAVVTVALCHVIEEALARGAPGQVAPARVTTRRGTSRDRPDEPAGSELSVELWTVATSHQPVDVDRPGGGAAARPQPSVSLDLHYLVTASGDLGALEEQRLLGQAALALASTPVLTSQVLRAAVTAHRGELGDWPDAEALVDAEDQVVVTPLRLPVEELSGLRGAVGHEPVPALTYVARVLLT